MTGPIKSLAASYLGAALFDTLLAVLTIWPLIKTQSKRNSVLHSQVAQRVVRGTAAYYCLVVLLSISCGALLLSDLPPHISSILTPIHASITISTACRVHLYLKDWARKNKGGAAAGPVHTKNLDGPPFLSSAMQPFSPPQSPVAAFSPNLARPPAVDARCHLQRATLPSADSPADEVLRPAHIQAEAAPPFADARLHDAGAIPLRTTATTHRTVQSSSPSHASL